MKKGFIEMIENRSVIIIYDDRSKDVFPIDLFPQDVKIDMRVCVENGRILDVLPPSKELKKEIDELTSKLFVSFKDRKKKS
ncbi:MAG: hypothetical protein PHY42_00350 [Bacilli bacterium]|nr:hypothetical protein [Bacilli bacterium]